MWKLTVCLLAAIALSNGSPIIQEEAEREMLCNVCRTLVHEVSEYVTDHSRQPGIKDRMMGVCGGLPQGLEREECQAAVHAFSPRMVEFFLHSMDPTAICSHMKVCPMQEVEEKPQAPPRVESGKEQAGPLCELCEFLIQTVDTYLKENKTLAAINSTVYKVCNSLPQALKDSCLGFAPEIVKVLAGGADPTTACTDIKLCTSEFGGWESVTCPVCQHALDAIMPKVAHEMCDYLRVCPVEEEEKPARASQVEAGPGCELCELLVQAVDSYLKENKSEAAINSTVYKLCLALPGALKDTCLGFAPSLVSILSQGVDPKEACTKLRLCDETELGGVERSHVTCEVCKGAVEAILPHDFHEMCSHIDMCPAPKEEKPEPVKKEQAGPLCELCEFLVQTVDAYLKDNKSEAAINATVYKVCNSLPDPIKTTCLSFAPMLVQALSKGLDPKKACTDIKLCTGDGFHWDTLTCGFCQDVVHSAFGEEDFHKMCSHFDMCPAPEEEKPEPVKKEQAGPLCELCEFLVQTVDAYLKDNKSEAAINATVYKVCNSLPDPIKTTCLGFAPMLVQALSKGLDPKKACTDIKLCTGDGFHWDTLTCAFCQDVVHHAFGEEDFHKMCSHFDMCPAPEEEKPEPVKKEQAGPLCELCEFLVQTVDAYLKDNKSEAAINATVYKVCNSLPDPIKTTCLGFAPMLVQALSKGLDPKKACTDIKLCTGDGFHWDTLTCGFCQDIVHSAFGEEEFYKRCVDFRMCAKRPVKKEDVQQPQEKAPVVRERRAVVEEKPDLKCEACKLAVSTIDDDLYQDEDKVKKMLDDVCHRLPPPTDQKCLDYVDPNFDRIWENILRNITGPDQLCELLGLCPKQPQFQVILT